MATEPKIEKKRQTIGKIVTNNLLDFDKEDRIKILREYLFKLKLFQRNQDLQFIYIKFSDDIIDNVKISDRVKCVIKTKDNGCFFINKKAQFNKTDLSELFMLRCSKEVIVPHELHISHEIIKNAISRLKSSLEAILIFSLYPNLKMDKKLKVYEKELRRMVKEGEYKKLSYLRTKAVNELADAIILTNRKIN